MQVSSVPASFQDTLQSTAGSITSAASVAAWSMGVGNVRTMGLSGGWGLVHSGVRSG